MHTRSEMLKKSPKNLGVGRMQFHLGVSGLIVFDFQLVLVLRQFEVNWLVQLVSNWVGFGFPTSIENCSITTA